MPVRKAIVLASFFLLFWLALMLVNIFVHELGHALTAALSGGWQNNYVTFGSTYYAEPGFMLNVVDWLQASGLEPQELGREETLQLLVYLAQRSAPVRYGVLGGWLGQLLAALLIWLVIRTRTYQAEASSFARLFWGSFVLVTIAWIGGGSLRNSLFEPNSTDSAVLRDVILNRQVVGLATLALASILLLLAAIWLASKQGHRIYAPLGLNRRNGRQLAFAWVGVTAVAAFLLEIPLGFALPLIFVAVVAVPTWVVSRSAGRDESVATVSPFIWLGTLLTLFLILLVIVTNSGLVVNGLAGDEHQLQTLQLYYCQHTACIPEDVLQWFR